MTKPAGPVPPTTMSSGVFVQESVKICCPPGNNPRAQPDGGGSTVTTKGRVMAISSSEKTSYLRPPPRSQSFVLKLSANVPTLAGLLAHERAETENCGDVPRFGSKSSSDVDTSAK